MYSSCNIYINSARFVEHRSELDKIDLLDVTAHPRLQVSHASTFDLLGGPDISAGAGRLKSTTVQSDGPGLNRYGYVVLVSLRYCSGARPQYLTLLCAFHLEVGYYCKAFFSQAEETLQL